MKENGNLNFLIKEMVGDIEDLPFQYPKYITKTKTKTPPFGYRGNQQTRKPDYETNITKENSMAEGLPQHP